jgi:hypothetical protein
LVRGVEALQDRGDLLLIVGVVGNVLLDDEVHLGID